MPGFNKKFKKNHKQKPRGVSGIDAVKARNAAVTDDENDPKKQEDEEDSSSSEEEDEKPKDPNVFVKEKGKSLHEIIGQGQGRLNKGVVNEDEENEGAPTRKQREEIEKERKRRAYEKLHKEGKTDEAKADLERLAAIKAKREAVAKEREDKKNEEEASKAARKNANSTAAYTDALGGAKSRKMPGGKAKADECGDMYEAYRTEKKAETIDPVNALAGSIEACRIEEDDFM